MPDDPLDMIPRASAPEAITDPTEILPDVWTGQDVHRYLRPHFFICKGCGALVAKTMRGSHNAWHEALISMGLRRGP